MAVPKVLLFVTAGAIGGIIGDGVTEPILAHRGGIDPLILVIQVGTWFGVASGLIATAILIANGFYLRRRPLELRVLIGTLSGFAAGMASGALSQWIYQTFGAGEPLRVVCWGLAGVLSGLAIGFQITNMGAWRGVLGGGAGGLIGGLCFVLLDQVTAWEFGRFVGVGVIGAAIGGMLAFTETFRQTRWLEVLLPGGGKRIINLGATRVTLGSNELRNTVVVPGAPPMSHAFLVVDGRVHCEDLVRRSTRTANPGEAFQVGRATVRVQGKAVARKSVGPGTPAASQAASKRRAGMPRH